jgi:hypothetical protein
MTQDEKHVVQGRISIVQEQRFRLVTDDGRGLLLTLAESAPLEDSDLRRFHREGARVRVEYAGEPNVNSGVAYSIQLLEPA